jgi:hypothetical protein
MSRRLRHHLAAVIAGAIVTSAAPMAHAYVRAQTSDGIPIYWTESCTSVTLYSNGFVESQAMSRDEVAKSLSAAAHAWSPDAVTCSEADGGTSHPYFEIVTAMAPDGASAPAIASDGINVLVFHLTDWPAELSDLALAVTSVTKKRDGRILDADVEINAQSYPWANYDPGASIPSIHGSTPVDLQAAITHEFGHFIGLDHTCHGPADNGDYQVDNNGNTVPPCGPYAPEAVRQTVMYAIVEPGTTGQRVLSPDDIAGVCAIYAAGRDPKTCSLDLPDDGCGCSAGTSGRPVGGGGTVIFIGALASMTSRRPRRRPRSRS